MTDTTDVDPPNFRVPPLANGPAAPQAKIRLDMAELTLNDMAEIGQLLGKALSDAMTGAEQALGIAAVAWVLHRRDVPDFTYEQARKLRLADIDLVNSAESEQPSGSNGTVPLLSPATGP